MIEALIQYEKHIQHILDRAVFLAPTTWMNLPGPSFLDPVMKQIKDLQPPYVGGNNWNERRKELCEQLSNEVLCQHPFMQESKNPITVKEWELLQQNADAQTFQEYIETKDHVLIGQKSKELDVSTIKTIKTAIINPAKGGNLSN